MELDSFSEKKVYKSKKNISGTKTRYIGKILRDLRQQMIINGASKEEITRFQYDFLTQNGINVPDSFLNIKQFENEYEILEGFIAGKLKVSKNNLYGNNFYDRYINYCIENKFKSIGKQETFLYLKHRGLMRKSGTINGETKRNVIIGYEFIENEV